MPETIPRHKKNRDYNNNGSESAFILALQTIYIYLLLAVCTRKNYNTCFIVYITLKAIASTLTTFHVMHCKISDIYRDIIYIISRTFYPRRRAMTYVIGHSISPFKNTPVFVLRFVVAY